MKVEDELGHSNYLYNFSKNVLDGLLCFDFCKGLFLGRSEGKNRLDIQKKLKFSLMLRGIKKITITNSKNFNM